MACAAQHADAARVNDPKPSGPYSLMRNRRGKRAANFDFFCAAADRDDKPFLSAAVQLTTIGGLAC